ncbi:MAG: IPT/TIG domain-containing protein [bacterium]|jgi:hypothetical protein|nr:MAG: hypothetical protein DIU52_07885 [bacterium]
MRRDRRELRIPVAIAAVLALTVCGDPSGPQGGRSIAIHGEAPRYGLVGTVLETPLRVVVTRRSNGEPLGRVSVSWRVVQGSGARIEPATSQTDSAGIASAYLRLGPEPGSYRVEAWVPGAVDGPAGFEVYAVHRPEILAITPDPVPAGDVVRITGRNFGPVPEDHVVLFGNFRGTVLDGSSTELEVVVPGCIPQRSVSVTVELGPVRSLPAPLRVEAEPESPLVLERGRAATLTSPGELACIRLPAGPASARYLLIAQNAHDDPDRDLPFQLAALTGPLTAPPLDPTPTHSVAFATGGPGEFGALWDAELRARERRLSPAAALPARGELRALGAGAAPKVGDRRQFRVINKDDGFTRVTAEVMHVSGRAVFYQDVRAPAGGFTATDFAALGRLFDDPIYEAVVSTFGEPSDVDGDGRITILFTPVVNEMTPRGSNGFIAGFFYGLDLTTEPNSNRAEIFYSLVPDPNGDFGDRRATSDVLRVVPPVLAHEFQHMIHFNQRFLLRRVGTEVQWLSEALAHSAEDIVAAALRERGQESDADVFSIPNLQRASRFLADPGGASLIGDDPPGSLEERGAQWLFLKYVSGHYGGADLLRTLTQTTRSGVDNVTAATGRSWSSLLADWSVALWAHSAPELQGVTLEPRFTYANVDLRQEFQRFGASYPLEPVPLLMQDFVASDTLPAASMDYLLLVAPGSAPPLNLNFAGKRGAPFSEPGPQLTILRVR